MRRGRDCGSGELEGDVEAALAAEISVVESPFLDTPPEVCGVLLFVALPYVVGRFFGGKSYSLMSGSGRAGNRRGS